MDRSRERDQPVGTAIPVSGVVVGAVVMTGGGAVTGVVGRTITGAVVGAVGSTILGAVVEVRRGGGVVLGGVVVSGGPMRWFPGIDAGVDAGMVGSTSSELGGREIVTPESALAGAGRGVDDRVSNGTAMITHTATKHSAAMVRRPPASGLSP